MAIKKEGTIGAAALLAVAATFIGISVQTGSKSGENGRSDAAVTKAATSNAKETRLEYKPGCGSLRDQLKDFLGLKEKSFENWICPDPAQLGMSRFPGETSGLHFVIALAPDPAHSHLSLLFDEIAVAVQEAAQDEKYDFDSSWLPWDDEKSSYPLLEDQKRANKEKEAKETQPGIILFRNRCPSKNTKPGECDDDPAQTFRQGLVVFVVGEEATGGVHRDQFRNATAWIAALHSMNEASKKVAILGPTFSGSLPSLQQLLADDSVKSVLGLPDSNANQLAIYSGSVSSKEAAEKFHEAFPQFHSFVQNDDEILERFFNYMCDEQGGAARRIVILSEDETAYGRASARRIKGCGDNSDFGPLRLYYPRDISALRDAYQSKLTTQSGAAPQLSELRRSLPRDLADPGGRVRDTIRSYGGNQTPLAQESVLMQILAELHDHRATYIVLRGSNALDQLFLADFLHRSYPDGRIVLFSADLLFMRERGADSLKGMLTLSTYPLVTHVHEWTEYPKAPAATRAFSADAVEGVYIALRLLLNTRNLESTSDTGRCRVPDGLQNEKNVFLPIVTCGQSDSYSPIPDYSAPFWINRVLSNNGDCSHWTASHDGTVQIGNSGSRPDQQASDNINFLAVLDKGQRELERYQLTEYARAAVRNGTLVKSGDVLLELVQPYCGPSTWLSAIGVNRFWPVASLARQDDNSAKAADNPLAKAVLKQDAALKGPKDNSLGTPLQMNFFFLLLAGFAAFHLWCCSFGSYTAKPAFRAHFASQGEFRHTALIFLGSCLIALMSLVAGLGSGVFFVHPHRVGLPYPWFAAVLVVFIVVLAGLAIVFHGWNVRQLLPQPPKWLAAKNGRSYYMMSCVFFLVVIVSAGRILFVWLEHPLLDDMNRVLTHWRAVHLFSGLSPIIPIFALLVGLYFAFWLALHGLALFGPDRPLLPPMRTLNISFENGMELPLLRMFSHEDAGQAIEESARPLHIPNLLIGAGLCITFFLAALMLPGEVPIRSLGRWNYSMFFLAGLDVCCTLMLLGILQFANSWVKLKRLLTFLDRLTLRRTLTALHGFSWESVWKMSGNVLEVRYKIISRQIESMNHTLAALRDAPESSLTATALVLRESHDALMATMKEARGFAVWYSENYRKDRAGDLTSFQEFQQSIAATSGTLLTKLLIPAWRAEEDSLIADPFRPAEDKESPASKLPRAKDPYIRNAEELVCLTYLGFIQNALGRLRTIALTIVVLFLACTLAISSYPFDPRQGLSVILVVLFVISGVVMVKVYAEMHRDSTLSHVTNTRPGELGSEFWFKIVGVGLAPLIGLLSRIFPGVIDFIFSWIQPGISSLK